MKNLTRGEFVRLTYNGQTMKAMVMLASTNGKSLMLGFEGALMTEDGGMFIGSMPVLQDDDGTFRDLVAGGEVTFEVEQ